MQPLTRASLLTRPFVLCSLSNLLQGIAFSLFIHIPGFLAGLGAGPVVIGWIFGLTSIVAIAVRPAVGRTMDRHGRRRLILAGHALNVGVLGLYLGLDSIGPALYTVRVLHGLAEAILFTVLFTYAADQVPTSRLTEGLAIFGVSGMLPMSIGGVLGDWILQRSDYAALFVTAWVFAAFALLAALPLRDPAPAAEVGAAAEPPRGFLAVGLEPRLLPVWWMSSVFFLALAAIFVFLKTFVMARGIGSVGSFFSAYTGVAILLRIGLGWLPDRIGPKRVLMPALAALAAGFLCLASAESDRDVLIAGVLCGIGHGYAFPILFALVVARARARERGSAVAIYTGLSDLGVVIGGPLCGLVLERSGYGSMYSAVAAIVVLGAVIFLVWDRRALPAPALE